MHRQIVKRLRRIEGRWPGVGQTPAMPRRLVRTIDEFGAQPRNQDGRGLTAAAREIVVRTLKHIETAIRKSGGRDNLAREARRLLKSLAHIDDFETTAQRASDFFGEVLKAGRRRARETPVCKPQTHVCGDLHGVGEIRLCRVASVADLQKVGRTLGLCVAHANEIGRPYHHELKNGESEFWTLCTPSGPFALLTVERENGTPRVTEFQGRNGRRATDEDGRRLALSGVLLRNVLRRLKADASDEPQFSRVGAFRSLLSRRNRESYSDVEADGRCFRVWRFPDEFIVASSKRRPRTAMPGRGARWSRFVRCDQRRVRRPGARRPQAQRPAQWEEGAWHDTAMDLGELLELLRLAPELYDVFVGDEDTDESK